jgi:hypothetical protein
MEMCLGTGEEGRGTRDEERGVRGKEELRKGREKGYPLDYRGESV